MHHRLPNTGLFAYTTLFRSLTNIDRKAGETLTEGAEVLTRQQRGWHHHCHLKAFHCGEERSAKCNFRLAEPNVAANEPVHWPARSEEHTSELQSRENLVCRL